MVTKVLTNINVEKICNLYKEGFSLENIVKKNWILV